MKLLSETFTFSAILVAQIITGREAVALVAWFMLFVSLCLCFCFFNFHLLMGLSSDNYLVKLKNFVRFSQSTQLNKRL